MTADVTTGSVFSDNTSGDYVTLTITPGDNGTTSVDGYELTEIGTVYTVNYTVDSVADIEAQGTGTYVLSAWSDDLASYPAISPLYLVMTADVTTGSVFSDNTSGDYVILSVTAGTNGTTAFLLSDMASPMTLTPSVIPYSVTAYKDTQVFLTAAADTDYAFDGWSGDFSGYGAVSPLIFTITADTSAVTSFSDNSTGNRVILTITAGENGTTTVKTTDMTSAADLMPSATPYTVTADKDSQAELTAVPDTGYSFKGWQGDLLGRSAQTLDLTVTNDTVTGSKFFLTPETCFITAVADDGCDISPSGVVAVKYGNSETFVFTPAEGYVIAFVFVDGKSVSIDGMAGGGQYTFGSVTANHLIMIVSMAGSGGGSDGNGGGSDGIGEGGNDGGSGNGNNGSGGNSGKEWPVTNLLFAIRALIIGLIVAFAGKRPILRVLAPIAGIVSVLVFFLTEDIGGSMALSVDGWTAFSVILLIAVIIMAAFSSVGKASKR